MAAPEVPEPRVERMLDSAAELLVRWGYQRVTIDEVARHAGIGKGTVYLHFRSKDALFLTVLLREQRKIVQHLADRMDADPRTVLPGATMRLLYEQLVSVPVARSVYLGDAEVLGRLAHEAGGTLGELAAARADAVRQHIHLLGAAGCLRPGLPPDSALYAFAATASGFLLVDGFGYGDLVPDVEERSALLEQTIAAAVQAPDPPAAELARIAPEIAQRYRSLLVHVDQEWRRRVR
ncbi:TetR/AcrR family transcriptional regulator [Pseudonocardia kunmingensis]|uniref:TetR family transcriptional regulator n=1 Tax=Pseudonocardia kunmingensis TaxID=630975 RepID=A0A543E0A3_9PSEU|nr:TetR/AcrR family transcriptional regulator [Pseudonocardia kunmingensis]TQM14964.1 TetR family transcriptional regulator [Pseudonocardia kunmingensis]